MNATVAMLGASYEIPYAYGTLDGLGQGLAPESFNLAYMPSSSDSALDAKASKITTSSTEKQAVASTAKNILSSIERLGLGAMEVYKTKMLTDTEKKALAVANQTRAEQGLPPIPVNTFQQYLPWIVGGVGVLVVGGMLIAVSRRRRRRR